MAPQIATPQLAPGVVPPQVPTVPPGAQFIPFHRAAGPVRSSLGTVQSLTQTTSQQPLTSQVGGTGFIVWIDLEVNLVTAANIAAVALAEDAPWAALASITLDDGGPQMINIDGFGLFLLNLYGGYGMTDPTASSDAGVYSAITTGAGGTAGSGRFRYRIPIAVNPRDYFGLLGNQDRATKYNLRNDLGPGTAIYSTAPTSLPTTTITQTLGSVPVPGPQAADGRPQEQIPPAYGVVHYMTSVRSDAAPAPSSAVNHYIRNLSNAVRLFILVFRAGAGATPRATAESNMPTAIDFKVGTDVLYHEDWRERRRIMWDHYRIAAPSGVLVYDFLDDFGPIAGFEIGDKLLYLGNVSECQFVITYPSGFTAGGSLTVITDSLYIPAGLSLHDLAL